MTATNPASVPVHIEHAYPARAGAMTNGGDHIVLDADLNRGRLHRKAGDALCKPARKFWGLSISRYEVDCKRCIDIAARHGIPVPTHIVPAESTPSEVSGADPVV